ncbi:hypothetical protein B0H16DRAFT_1777737 [Mycena metata]|uniref:Uncharacterized protein n=1 Tax=Mycena metata TaxID=1033252 RepID=A0AAD7HTZ3_9AGAR|nr:hypothetical protein B0H16DRAFT_1777737 [Mycena metata]
MSSFDPKTILGPFEVGILISYVLFGVMTSQTYIYYRRFIDDPPRLKVLVAFIWLCEVAHTACVGYTLYDYTISNHTNPERLAGAAPKSFDVAIVLSAVIGASVQGFFSFRIYVFSKKPFIPILIWIMALWHLLACIVLTGEGIQMTTMARYETKWGWLATACWSVSTVNDWTITATLVFLLHTRRTDVDKRTINDPTLSLADKVIQWCEVFLKRKRPENNLAPICRSFLNIHNHLLIACAALKNNKELALSANVGIFLRLVGERTGSKYDNRTFVIERVALFPRETSDAVAARTTWKYGNTDGEHSSPEEHSKMLVGYCMLPNGKLADTQLWLISIPRLYSHILPPNFDLHQYITHVNRGVTHFHASFWNISRDISDSELEVAEPPDSYCDYAFSHLQTVSGLKGQGVIGIQNEDGTRTPLFKRAQSGHIRKCAPGETDSDGPAAYKKLIADPSRIVKKIMVDLDAWYEIQDMALRLTEKRYPVETVQAQLLKYGAALD